MSFTLAEIRNGTGWDRNARFELVDSRREENYAKLQELGKRTAESLAEMVAALECDYDRLGELRAEQKSADYYECGTCGEYHKTGYGGDCRDDSQRFSPEHLEAHTVTAIFPLAEAMDLAELESAAGDCESREDAERRIQENPLSIELTGTWQPGETPEASGFIILLSTGGPATRIRGELDAYSEPCRAWIETQDWFLPWTEYHGDAISQDDLLTYCRCFYFGE